MNSDFYINNRSKFASKLQPNSFALLFSGQEIAEGIDTMYPFYANKNFVWLTGIDKPDCWLVMTEDKSILFIPDMKGKSIAYYGKQPSTCEYNTLTGIPEQDIIEYNTADTFERNVGSMLTYGKYKNVCFDFIRPNNKRSITIEEKFANKLLELFPNITIKNMTNDLSKLRSVKSAEEIKLIKHAVDITGQGIIHMLNTCKSKMYEYEWQAEFEYIVKKNGCSLAFNSIFASGENALELHYENNNCVVSPNDFLLLDVDAKYKGYCGDISRTYPANGKFSQRQKDIYMFAQECVDVVTENMKPGYPYGAHVRSLFKTLAKGLKTLKLESDLDYMLDMHSRGTCHYLGLDAHDGYAALDDEILPGMVFTNEPGIYFNNEGIGVRIEEDLIITEVGNEIISSNIPVDIREIEHIMA